MQASLNCPQQSWLSSLDYWSSSSTAFYLAAIVSAELSTYADTLIMNLKVSFRAPLELYCKHDDAPGCRNRGTRPMCHLLYALAVPSSSSFDDGDTSVCPSKMLFVGRESDGESPKSSEGETMSNSVGCSGTLVKNSLKIGFYYITVFTFNRATTS